MMMEDIDFEQMSKETGIPVEELKEHAAEYNKFLEDVKKMSPDALGDKLHGILKTLDKLTDIYMDNVVELLKKEAGIASLFDMSVVVGVGAHHEVAFSNWIGDCETAASIGKHITECAMSKAKEEQDGQGVDAATGEEQI